MYLQVVSEIHQIFWRVKELYGFFSLKIMCAFFSPECKGKITRTGSVEIIWCFHRVLQPPSCNKHDGETNKGKCPSVWCICCHQRLSFPVQPFGNIMLRHQKCLVTPKEGKQAMIELSINFWRTFERMFLHWKILICQNCKWLQRGSTFESMLFGTLRSCLKSLIRVK